MANNKFEAFGMDLTNLLEEGKFYGNPEKVAEKRFLEYLFDIKLNPCFLEQICSWYKYSKYFSQQELAVKLVKARITPNLEDAAQKIENTLNILKEKKVLCDVGNTEYNVKLKEVTDKQGKSLYRIQYFLPSDIR